jgi:hypothetical protein
VEASDEGLQGLLEVATELFDGWTWACAVDQPGSPRILQACPLDAEERAAVERWAMELLRDTASGALEALEQAVSSPDLAIRAFVVEDPGARSLAVMGFGPPQGVSPEGDVILDAVARNLSLLDRRPPATA